MMSPTSMTISLLLLFSACQQLVSCQQQQQQQQQKTQQQVFPGVAKDLASFCAARPSLPVDLASMVVHVKRNVSFNYKLYLFSGDHVFQTGQVIPRDDFRVHSFPVRFKRFHEFWPPNLAPVGAKNNGKATVNLKEFFRLVPLEDSRGRQARKVAPEDAAGDPLPGEAHLHRQEPFISHDVAHVVAKQQQQQQDESASNVNKFIEFDRDDQISRLNQPPPNHSKYSSRSSELREATTTPAKKNREPAFEDLVLPVGSFSSFHVNLTYLVRKDFDQGEPQLLRVLVDAGKFQVSEWEVMTAAANKTSVDGEEFAFLSHKLLRDPNTRITSINQIYEDWIMRNFYTIVYVQRRLASDEGQQEPNRTGAAGQLVSDRLIFRGSSSALLGADQLDHQVKASAFITEKNGLHYYIEFLNTGKFYLCALDWSKRPFKIIDWQQFPIKATRTQFDNEELLLCPPAVCYSQQPIDEIVAYGRLDWTERQQREISQLLVSSHSALPTTVTNQPEQSSVARQNDAPIMHSMAGNATTTTFRLRSRSANGDEQTRQIIEFVRAAALKGIGSSTSEIRLHLRDWIWTLTSAASPARRADYRQPGGLFTWRYEQAKRNDIKAKQDAYGYTLSGHEVDASYRIYNELYLISANHLIAINYTLANETVIGSIPVGEEFPGLSSTLIDPITGAYYDRYTNRLYFFKSDRYIGFDYATRKPLEEFVLKPSYLHAALLAGDESEAVAAAGPQILSSQPVVEILGRQHQVDAIYHDLPSDLVYIFTGMKFYTFQASEFKDGAFRSAGELPQMHCINERFLQGCTFDKAYPNPCESQTAASKIQSAKLKQQHDHDDDDDDETSKTIVESLKDFNQEQQMKLRTIASKAGLLNVLVENSLIGKSIRTLEPLMNDDEDSSHRAPARDHQEKLVIYLLMAIVVVTILITIVMIIVMIGSTSRKSKTSRAQQAVLDQLSSVQLPRHTSSEKPVMGSLHPAVKRISTGSNHLTSNQSRHLRPYHVPASVPRSKPLTVKSSRVVNGRLQQDSSDIVDNSVL